MKRKDKQKLLKRRKEGRGEKEKINKFTVCFKFKETKEENEYSQYLDG